MSPLRKHPIDSPGKRDKRRRRKGNIGEGSSYLSPATQLGGLLANSALGEGSLDSASPTKVDFPHPAYSSRCLRVLSCQNLGPGCQRQENPEIQIEPYRTFCAFGGKGRDWCDVVSILWLKMWQAPEKAPELLPLFLQHKRTGNDGAWCWPCPESLDT